MLLAAVMCLRALVPVGYMLGPSSADGGIVLQICNAQTGNAYLLMDPETGETTEISHPGDQSPQGGDPGASCPFALSAVASLDIYLPVLSLPGYLPPEDYLPADDLAARPNLARAPPPARAPPVLV